MRPRAPGRVALAVVHVADAAAADHDADQPTDRAADAPATAATPLVGAGAAVPLGRGGDGDDAVARAAVLRALGRRTGVLRDDGRGSRRSGRRLGRGGRLRLGNRDGRRRGRRVVGVRGRRAGRSAARRTGRAPRCPPPGARPPRGPRRSGSRGRSGTRGASATALAWASSRSRFSASLAVASADAPRHPPAMDRATNASGAATLVELRRTVSSLVVRRARARPRAGHPAQGMRRAASRPPVLRRRRRATRGEGVRAGGRSPVLESGHRTPVPLAPRTDRPVQERAPTPSRPRPP